MDHHPNLLPSILQVFHQGGLQLRGEAHVPCRTRQIPKGQRWDRSIRSLFPKLKALSTPHINNANPFPLGSAIQGQYSHPSFLLAAAWDEAVSGLTAPSNTDGHYNLIPSKT